MFPRRLRIKLLGKLNDDEPAVVRQGELVHGDVTFTSPTFDRLNSVAVHFRGYSQVDARSNVLSTHREEITFFHRHYLIRTDGSGLLSVKARQPRTFPFEFIVPSITDQSEASLHSIDDDRMFEKGKHDLPPSLTSKDSKNAKIVYQMYAIATHVNQASGVGSQTYTPSTVSNVLTLNYTRMAPLYTPDHHTNIPSNFQRISESNSAPGQTLDNEQHKMMEKLSSGQLPDFNVALKLPSTCLFGKTVPLVATISTEKTRTGQNLDHFGRDVSIMVAVQAETHSRCAGPRSRPSQMDTKTQTLTTDQKSIKMVTGSPYPITYSSDTISSWPPSFRSYFVSRTYTLVVDISMTLDAFKGRYKAHFEAPVSAVHLPLDPSQYQPGVLRGHSHQIEELPSYEHARGLPNELPPAYEISSCLRMTALVGISC